MDSEEVQRGVDVAIGFIAFRSRSEFEVRRRLRKANVEPNVEDAVVRHLRELSLLDDRRFAGAYARDQVVGHKRGPVRVLRGLFSLGVDRGIAQDAVEAVVAENDLKGQALALGAKRWERVYTQSAPWKSKKKVYDFLIRRGYSHEMTRWVVNELEKRLDES